MAEADTDDPRDAEITLSTGKLLGIFFGLVLLCSIFFTMGYMLGRSNAAGSKTEIVATESGGNSADKPSAVSKTNVAEPPANPSASQGNPPVVAVAPAASPAPAAVIPAAISVGTSGADASKAAPAGATFLVQVAAVSKREDADLLVSGLQKKQYPAFVTGASGDALFHVQVGPFSDPKDAETMRGRLVGEGYNPIVKRSN